jgi:fermentation-respiration switch protein FrsA (DUF1100 family)
MSRLISDARIEAHTTIRLNEDELRALAFIASFGAEAVILKLGALSDNVHAKHRDALWSFFDELHQNAGNVTRAIDRARAEFHSPRRTP